MASIANGRPTYDLSENAIFVLPIRPRELALLFRAFYAARGGLRDVDVCDPLFIDVFLHVEVDGREADGLAQEPANALL